MLCQGGPQSRPPPCVQIMSPSECSTHRIILTSTMQTMRDDTPELGIRVCTNANVPVHLNAIQLRLERKRKSHTAWVRRRQCLESMSTRPRSRSGRLPVIAPLVKLAQATTSITRARNSRSLWLITVIKSPVEELMLLSWPGRLGRSSNLRLVLHAQQSAYLVGLIGEINLPDCVDHQAC